VIRQQLDWRRIVPEEEKTTQPTTNGWMDGWRIVNDLSSRL